MCNAQVKCENNTNKGVHIATRGHTSFCVYNFLECTTVFCGEEHSTVSCNLPIVHGLMKHLEFEMMTANAHLFHPSNAWYLVRSNRDGH